MARVLAAMAWVMLAACHERPVAPKGRAPAVASAGQALCGEATDETVQVMRGLAPTCEGCHLTGTRAYFSSVSAFQNLIVSDPRLVNPQDPDNSELVRLLLGTGRGSFTQMPIGSKTYAQLVTEGRATLTIDAIKTWIAGLSTAVRDARPDAAAPRVTRMRAEQIQRTLYQQLGLSYSDFFNNATNFGIVFAAPILDDYYPFQPVDALPMPRNAEPIDRFYGLGGGSVFGQQRRDQTVGPTFSLTLLQLSQRWCRMGYRKANNTALFPSATKPTDEAGVKTTLRRWFTHFHGTKASDAEVNAMYDTVWVPLYAGAAANTEAAWVGACSSFIRHPDWVFY